MNAIQRFGFSHLRSWKRERGGTYAVYTFIHSRAYQRNMRRIHRRGLHNFPRHSYLTSPHCTWCGSPQA